MSNPAPLSKQSVPSCFKVIFSAIAYRGLHCRKQLAEGQGLDSVSDGRHQL